MIAVPLALGACLAASAALLPSRRSPRPTVLTSATNPGTKTSALHHARSRSDRHAQSSRRLRRNHQIPEISAGTMSGAASSPRATTGAQGSTHEASPPLHQPSPSAGTTAANTIDTAWGRSRSRTAADAHSARLAQPHAVTNAAGARPTSHASRAGSGAVGAQFACVGRLSHDPAEDQQPEQRREPAQAEDRVAGLHAPELGREAPPRAFARNLHRTRASAERRAGRRRAGSRACP